MPLAPDDRKRQLRYGKQREIAVRFRYPESFVSQVVGGIGVPVTAKGWRRYRRVQVAVARALKLRVEEAFSESERGISQQFAAA